MTPWDIIIERIVISFVFTCTTIVAYVYTMKFIKTYANNALKDILSVICAIPFVLTIVLAPFIYLLSSAEGIVIENGLEYFGTVGAAWLIIMACGIALGINLAQKLNIP